MLIAIVGGEPGCLDLIAVTWPSLLGFGYLVVFGSLVFPLYLWLLERTSAAKVATEAYVCPVIALALGIAVRGEPMSPAVVVSAVVVLVGVALIVTDRGTSPGTPESSQRPQLTQQQEREGGT